MDLQFLFQRIVCGYTLYNRAGKHYYIYDPTPRDHYLAEPHYQSTYESLILKGFPTEEHLLGLLNIRNLWGEKQENEVKVLMDNLHKLNSQLPNLEFKSTEKKQVLKYIEITKERINQLTKIKTSLLTNSAEYIAKLEKYKYLLFLLTKDEFNKSIWTLKTFNKESDSFLNELLIKSYFNENINEANIRKLARSEPWRSVWLCAIKTGNLFNRPSTDFTDYQRALVSWSLLYDNIFEHPEAPSSDIIDNDILLDQWLEQQAAKRKAESAANASNNILSNNKIGSSQEVGIVVDSIEDAEKVYKLNSPQAQEVIRKREKKIQSAESPIKELDLPDVRRNWQLEVHRLGIEKIKGNK